MDRTGADIELDLFLKTHYASMYAVAYKLLHSHEAAQDIIQDVISRLWHQQSDLGQLESVSDYLFIMVRNASLNHLRSEKRKIARYGNLKQENYDEPEFFRKLLKEELNQMLMSAIEKLPLQTARVIRLSLSGLDNKEISLLLNISINTVKTLKYSAIRKLREYFSKVDLG